VNTTGRVGAYFDQLASLSAIGDNCLSHLVARLLNRWNLSASAIRFCFLDIQLHISTSPQGSTLTRVPRGRNLHKLRLAFQRLRHVRVDLGAKALRVSALCGIWANCKSILLARSRRADRVGRGTGRCITFRTGKKSLQAPLAGTYSVYRAYPSGMGRL
jgi:hypothetical protein